jgi:hypothetical protein
MAKDIGTSGAKYNTKIPALSDNADIEAALRIYHYGSNTDNPSPIPDNSIAGFLGALESTKLSLTPKSIPNDYSNNLNSIVQTGFYSQPNSTGTTGAQAVGALGYPVYSVDSKAYAGMLEVVNDGVLVFQKYHMTDSKNVVFWRVGTVTATSPSISVNWGSGLNSGWKQATDESHIHDGRYYTETEMDGFLAKKPTSNLNNQKVFILPPDSTLVNGSAVPQGNPSSSDGDLWFW